MALLMIPTEASSIMDRLSPSWLRRSVSRSKGSAEERRSSFSLPTPTSQSFDGSDDRTPTSSRPSSRAAFRGMVNRLRSTSNASQRSNSGQDVNVHDAHDWFHGFQRYNQLVTARNAQNQGIHSQEFSKACRTLTKNCGGRFVHGLPESTFDLALLWCPTERASRLGNDEPTWSWSNFNGAVNFPLDPTTCPDSYGTPSSEGEYFRSEILHYHVGPASTPYTMRREKPGALRIMYPPYFHAPRGSDPSTESNMLRFSTKVVSAEHFTAEQLHYNGNDIPCSQLLNPAGQHCGVIMDFESSISEPCSTGPFEFVLLSRTKRNEHATHTTKPALPIMHPAGTPIWNGERFVWDEEVVNFDDRYFEVGDWKMLNVMLIRWVGDHAERVAIARIHEDAWKVLEPQKKDIVLR